ncbi:MAG: hypothetical protein CMJ37_02045 [Phycisphaerae bacterium]|nr:hypothetical protein [Phycisphaerae bacterium]
MTSPFANLALMAAHAVVTVASAHDGLEELLAQAHAAVAKHPEALAPRVHRASLYRQHQEWELANLDLQAAVKISGADDPVVMLGQAELDLAQGRAAEAVPLLLQLLTKENMSLVAHDRLGRAYAQIKQWRNCIEHLRTVIQQHPEPGPQHYMALSDAHRSAEDLEQAMAVLTRARKKFGPLLALEDRLAELESQVGRHADAIERITHVLDDAVRKEFWLARRADLREAAGQLTLAHIDRLRALRLIDGPQIRNEQSEATECLRKALRDAIQKERAPTNEDPSETDSASIRKGSGELGPQNPTE